MSAKELCANGGTLVVGIYSSENAFESVTLHANVSVSIYYGTSRVCFVRGALKTFHSTGNTVLDFANTKNAKFPNSGIDGIEDLVNVAWVDKIERGLILKGMKVARGAFQVKDGVWVKAEIPHGAAQVLDEHQETLAESMVDEATVKKLSKVADDLANAATARKSNAVKEAARQKRAAALANR